MRRRGSRPRVRSFQRCSSALELVAELRRLLLRQAQRPVDDAAVHVRARARSLKASSTTACASAAALVAEDRRRGLAARRLLDLPEVDRPALLLGEPPDPVAPVAGRLGVLLDEAVLRQRAQVEARLVGGDARGPPPRRPRATGRSRSARRGSGCAPGARGRAGPAGRGGLARAAASRPCRTLSLRTTYCARTIAQ